MASTSCILAVVSEPSDFATLSAHLQPTGLTLHRADGLLDAILRQADSPASVILCDADGLDWKEAVNLFRRMKTPGVETLDAGAFDLLEKPYRPEALCWVVSTALKRRTAQAASSAA